MIVLGNFLFLNIVFRICFFIVDEIVLFLIIFINFVILFGVNLRFLIYVFLVFISFDKFFII